MVKAKQKSESQSIASVPYVLATPTKADSPHVQFVSEVGSVLLSGEYKERSPRRAQVPAVARVAATELAKLAQLSEAGFAKQCVRFVRAYGHLMPIGEGRNFILSKALSGIDERLELADENPHRQLAFGVAPDARDWERSTGLRIAPRVLGAQVWDDYRADRIVARGENERWRRYRELVAQMRAFIPWDHDYGAVQVGSWDELAEPLALYRLASLVMHDLLDAEATLDDIEPSIHVAVGILRSQVHLRVVPSSRGTTERGSAPVHGDESPLPLSMAMESMSWLGSIFLAGLHFGPLALRRCAYRNCDKALAPVPAHKRYCSRTCGAAERVYRIRDERRMSNPDGVQR